MEKVTRFDQLGEGLEIRIDCVRCGVPHQLRLVERRTFQQTCPCGACNDFVTGYVVEPNPHPELGAMGFVSHIDIEAGVLWFEPLAKPSRPATA